MTIINEYTNGNTIVKLYNDGTKTREYEGIPSVLHPESIDVKITNYCDLGCKYCHESSTTEGKHADIDKLLDTLEELPAGVEIAIGGGNPLSHKDLHYFLASLYSQGLIANLTVNQGHLKKYETQLKNFIRSGLIKGLGISITSNNFKYVYPLMQQTENIVFHVIAGVNNYKVIDRLMKLGDYCKVLVLGYKEFGFGIPFYSKDVQENIQEWYRYLPKYLNQCYLSFDNLAIEQLNIRRLFTQEGWDKFYMGDDFCFTMYIDAVEQTYAPTSRSSERKSFNDYSLINYFQKYSKLKC